MEREEGGGDQCAYAVGPTTPQDWAGSRGQGIDREANTPSYPDRDPQQGGKEARWVAPRRGGTREQGGQSDEREEGKRGGRGQARHQRQRVEKLLDRGTRGKGAGGMAAGRGFGNLALCECAPRSVAGEWPHVAMVAGAAFTRILCSSCGGGGAGGRGGVRVVHIVHVCSGSFLVVSLNVAKDRQKTGVLRMCVRFLCTILGICTRGSDLDATLLAPISEWR